MPIEVFTHELFPIAIVGASSSGKSHYLAALKHRLVDKPRWGAGDKNGGFWNWSFVRYANPNNKDNESVDNPYVRYDERLYGDHFTLDSTKRDDEHPPLLLTVKYLHPIRRMFDEPRFCKRSLLVAITDTAGEHSHNESIRVLEENYPVLKKYVKGVIVMQDLNELHTSSAANVVLSWLKGKNEKSDLPIALCISKIDELSSRPELWPRNWNWLDAKNSNTDLSITGKLILPDIEHNSLAVRRWMAGNSMCTTAENIESSFRYRAFFAVSALGIDPFQTDISSGRPLHDAITGAMRLKKDRESLRVLDPFLWILWQHGKLGGVARNPLQRKVRFT